MESFDCVIIYKFINDTIKRLKNDRLLDKTQANQLHIGRKEDSGFVRQG